MDALVNVLDVDAAEFLDLFGDLELEFREEDRFGL